MNESSASRKFAFGRARASSGVRLAALCGGSGAAICRSLVSSALPGVLVGIGVFAVAESPLGAAAGRSHTPHVRIVLDARPEAVPLHEVQPRIGSRLPATFARARPLVALQPGSPEPALINVPPVAVQTGAKPVGSGSREHGSATDLLAGWTFSGGTTDAGQTGLPITSASFDQAIVPAIHALLDQVVVPRIALDMSALSFAWVPQGLGDIVTDPVSQAAVRLDPVLDSVAAALNNVRTDPLVDWGAVRALGDSVFSGAALALRTAEAIALPLGANPGKQAPGGGDPIPDGPVERVLRAAIAVRNQDIDAAPSLMEQVGLTGFGAAMTRPGEAGENAPPIAAQAPVGDFVSEFTANGGAPSPSGRYAYGAIHAEGTAERLPMPGGTVQLTEAFSYNKADTPPLLVRLGTVVEILGDRFEAEELERLRNSKAFDAYLPLSELQAAGIPVSRDLLSSTLPLNAAAAQSAPGGFGGSATDVSSDGGVSFSGWKQSLTATASAGFDSNPFLFITDNPEAASMRVQINPTVTRSGERGTLRLSARAEHIEYLGEYDSLQNFGADLGASRRVSERLEIDGGLNFASNILATNLANPFANGDAGPDAAVPPTGNDVTILGQGQRRTQYGGNAGLTYVLSERDQLSWSVSARADRFGAEGLIDSNFYAQQFQYSRRLNEGLTVGAAVNASLITFTGVGRGDARTISPQVQVTAALTPRIELSGSAGLAITRLEFGGLEETTTAFAGNVSLCRSGDRSNLCVNGSRQVLPAAIGGALLQTTAGLSYSLRLSERDTLQLSGNYATASQPLGGILADFESINGFARYERQLDERMRLFVSAGALNTSGNRPTDQTNYQGLVGVTFTLGQSR